MGEEQKLAQLREWGIGCKAIAGNDESANLIHWAVNRIAELKSQNERLVDALASRPAIDLSKLQRWGWIPANDIHTAGMGPLDDGPYLQFRSVKLLIEGETK